MAGLFPTRFAHLRERLFENEADSPCPWRASLIEQQVVIDSAFQPIFSFPHRRIVGHEALMRPRCRFLDTPRSPLAVLEHAAGSDFDRVISLDRLCRVLHLANFAAQARPDSGWLFLNMDAQLFLREQALDEPGFLAEILTAFGLQPSQLVLEILENQVDDVGVLVEAAARFRQMGALVAIDDFGAGASNIDRIWRVRPEIVKLDRSLAAAAAVDSGVKRFLKRLVPLLHETGAMVLLEGIETPEEAFAALDAGVDFAQGWLFGRPEARLFAGRVKSGELEELWWQAQERLALEKEARNQRVAPYVNAIGYASTLLSAGRPLSEAAAAFLELPEALVCFTLDASGYQIGDNLRVHARPLPDPRLAPLADNADAIWARRIYFRTALSHFGKVQVTRPYASLTEGSLCRTISVSYKAEGETRVLCGDVLWQE